MLYAVRPVLAFSCLLLAYAPMARAEETAHEDPVAAHDAAVDAAHGGVADATAHAAAEHGGGGGGLPQFDPSSFASQVFWLAIAFAFLYIFFKKKTLPDIASVLKKRETHIRSTLESAKRQKEVAEGLQRDYEIGLDRARQDALNAFALAEKAIKENAEQKTKVFQQKALVEIQKTEAAIEKSKAAVMDDMHAIAAEIASKAAEKIIGVETDIDHAKTVVRSLKAKAA